MWVNIYENILAYKQATIKQVSMYYLGFPPASEKPSLLYSSPSDSEYYSTLVSKKYSQRSGMLSSPKCANCFLTLNLAATYQGLGNHSLPLYALSQTHSQIISFFSSIFAFFTNAFKTSSRGIFFQTVFKTIPLSEIFQQFNTTGFKEENIYVKF